jgi:hypothetical protein
MLWSHSSFNNFTCRVFVECSVNNGRLHGALFLVSIVKICFISSALANDVQAILHGIIYMNYHYQPDSCR